MSETVSKFTLAAGIMLALAFTFSCSVVEDIGGSSSSSSGGNSFSYCLISGQCLSGSFTSKECGDLGGLPSNSCNGGGGKSSSSGGGQGGNPSSSSNGGGGGGGKSSSSGGGGSSSSVGGQGGGVVNGIPVTYEGETYSTVVIGSQTWFAKNLNYNASGSKCYDDDPENCTKYGRLYDWYTAKTACPNGWHLPSEDEWKTLKYFVDRSWISVGEKLKATDGWRDCGPSGSGKRYLCEDSYGFSALPGGSGWWTGGFDDVGDRGGWWSASDDDDGIGLSMSYSGSGTGGIFGGSNAVLRSVRCLQD